MFAYAMTTAVRIDLLLLCAIGLWLLGASATATYGYNRGFRFWPLLACGIFLGFPLVLLALTVATPFLDIIATQKMAAQPRQETQQNQPAGTHALGGR